jgi:hypothetical protein
MRSHPLLIALPLAAALSLAIPAATALEPEISAATLNERLSRFRLAGRGAVFIQKGAEFGIDPRLIAAIAGAETTFGNRLCGTFNAWNWFWNGTCAASPFESFERGIHTVSKYMVKSYLRKGYTTISLIGTKYCAEGCEHWEPLVTEFYEEMGGDPSDLTYSAAAPPVDPGPVDPPPVDRPPVDPSPVDPSPSDDETDAGEESAATSAAVGSSTMSRLKRILLLYVLPPIGALALFGGGIAVGMTLRRPTAVAAPPPPESDAATPSDATPTPEEPHTTDTSTDTSTHTGGSDA